MRSGYQSSRPASRSKKSNRKRITQQQGFTNNNYLKARTEGIERTSKFNVSSPSKQDEQRLKSKYFVEQSIFLPSILAQHSIRTPLRLNSTNNESRYKVNALDTESETIQALTECQLIIENLKKLTNSTQAKSIRRELPNNLNYQQRNLKVSGLRKESRSVTGTGSDVVIGGGGDGERFASYLMSKEDLFGSRNRIKETDKNERVKRLSQNSGYSNSFDENLTDDKKIGDRQKQGRERQKRANSEQKQVLLDLQVIHKKQRYMIKYLGRAKIGGCNLHQKIKQFKQRIRTERQSEVVSRTSKQNKGIVSKKEIQQKDEIFLKQR